MAAKALARPDLIAPAGPQGGVDGFGRPPFERPPGELEEKNDRCEHR